MSTREVPKRHVTPWLEVSTRTPTDRPRRPIWFCVASLLTVVAVVRTKPLPGKSSAFNVKVADLSAVEGESRKSISGTNRRMKENWSPSPISTGLDSMKADSAEPSSS